MLDADKSHLDVTWVSQSLYSGPLSNPDSFLSLIAGRIRQVVLYLCKKIRSRFLLHKNNVHLKSVHHFLCEISSSYTKSNGHLTVHSRKIMDSFTIG